MMVSTLKQFDAIAIFMAQCAAATVYMATDTASIISLMGVDPRLELRSWGES